MNAHYSAAREPDSGDCRAIRAGTEPEADEADAQFPGGRAQGRLHVGEETRALRQGRHRPHHRGRARIRHDLADGRHRPDRDWLCRCARGDAMRAKGAPVKIMAPILKTNGFAIISLEESRPQEARGPDRQEVAVQAGTAQTTLLDAILIANKIDRGNSTSSTSIRGVRRRACSRRRSMPSWAAPISSRSRSATVASKSTRSITAISACRRSGCRSSRATTRSRPIPNCTRGSLRRASRAGTQPARIRRRLRSRGRAISPRSRSRSEAARGRTEAVCAPGASALGRVPDKKWQMTYELLTQYLQLPKDKPSGDYYTTSCAGERAGVPVIMATATTMAAAPSRRRAGAPIAGATSPSVSPRATKCSRRSTVFRSPSRAANSCR